MLRTPEAVTIEPDAIGRLKPGEIEDHLERGDAIFFPTPPVPLPPEEDLVFLREELPGLLSKKNISYYPLADRVIGMRGDHAQRERAARILRDYYGVVEEFVKRVMPTVTRGMSRGTASFRPVQEQGRTDVRQHAKSERVHVDAGAYGATHGDRIFRFFTNVNVEEDRVWRVKGTLPDLLAEYGKVARVGGWADPPESIEEGPLDRAYSAAIRGLCRISPMARSLDSSPFDRAMRKLHNYMVDSDEFQESPEGERVLRFPPMSSWMAYADMVGHACRSGQHAIINTFLLRQEATRNPELQPARLVRGPA